MPSVGYATLQIIPSLRGIKEEIRRQIGDLEGEGQRSGQQFGGGLTGALKTGAAAAGVAAGALLVKGISEAMEQANITSTLQAQLGTSNKVAAQQGKVAGKLYSSGVSGSFQEAADAIKSVVQAGLAPPDATNKQLQAIATKASDVATVFGQDLGGVTNAVSQMMRTGLAKNANQAFDLITKGFQGGADKGGDFLDTINEYGTQFRKAGLDGASAIGLLNQAIRAGARDSDVAADAIKEFSIRAVDGSDTTADGFTALGLNADDMAAKFAKGGSAANAVLDLTLDRLRGIKDPVAQSQAAVALFGTQAEDLGQALFAMDPSKAAKGLGNFGGAADKVGKTIRSGPSHEIEVFKRALETGLVNVLGGQVLPIISEVAHWFNANLLPPIRAVASVAAAVLVPALRGIFEAGVGVVNWLRDMGAWLIPIGVLIGGLTLMLSANAIATAGVTAAFSIYRGVILAWSAVTRVATAVQAAWNAVMALNPIGLVVIALVALGAALVVAYKKSDTFRAIVQATWNGIKTGALWVWNTVLKPFFAWFGRVVLWLWNNIIKPYIGFIVAYWKMVGRIAMWLWRTILVPAFQAIGKVIALWWSGVKTYFSLVMAIFQALGRIGVWLWQTIIKPVFNGIVSAAKLWWSGVKTYFNLVMAGLRAVGSVFRWLWNNVIKPVWNGIKATISTVWNRGIKPTFDALKRGVNAVRDGFKRGVDAIGRIWNGLKAVARRPVQFVVDTVYNNGIRKVWNTVAGFIGLKKLAAVKFADGGRTRGGTPGKDSIPALMMADEFVVKRDSARRVGFGTLEYINRYGELPGFAQGGQVQRFADGGVVGWLTGAAKKVGSWIGDGAKFLADPGKAWEGITRFIRDKIKQIGASRWAQAIAQFPLKMLSGLKSKILKAAGSLFSGGGGDLGAHGASAQAAQRIARLMLGRYGWSQGQMPALIKLWNGESGWRWNALNASSGAYGIPQALPAGKMASAGSDWRTNAATQIRWGLGYIKGRYGSPSGAWAFWNRQSPHWYDDGGWLQPGVTTAVNATGQPEAVLTGPQWRAVSTAAAARGLEPGQEVTLVVEDGPTLRAYVDTRADGRVTARNRELVTALNANRRG